MNRSRFLAPVIRRAPSFLSGPARPSISDSGGAFPMAKHRDERDKREDEDLDELEDLIEREEVDAEEADAEEAPPAKPSPKKPQMGGKTPQKTMLARDEEVIPDLPLEKSKSKKSDEPIEA